MGVVRYSGPVASFHCPTEATIRSLKVHFSPKQLGSGTPSPENVREIVGWDGVTVHNDIEYIPIPAEYQRIEYIYNTGTTEWIDTGIVPYTNTKAQIKVMNLNWTGDVILGYYAGNDTTDWRIFNFNTSFYFDTINEAAAGSLGRRWFGAPWLENAVYEFEIGNFYAKNLITNQYIFQQAANEFTGTNTITMNSYGTVGSNRCSKNRWYYVKIYDGDTLVRDMYPCRRKSDNKPGMYDTVSGEFFTNQGTGEFVCGPDVGETIKYEFGALGKNKVPWISPDGFIIEKAYNGNSGWSAPWAVPENANGIEITYSADIDNTNGADSAFLHIWTKDENDSFVDTAISSASLDIGSSGRLSKTITLNTDRYSYVIFGLTMNNATASHPMVEFGSTATTYEPYDPNHTVYGGWVDLVSGEVREEWKSYDLTELSLTQFGIGEKVLTISAFPEKIKSRNAMYCNILPPVSNPNISGVEGVDWNNGRLNICLSTSRELDTQEKVEQWLNDLKTNSITPIIVANTVNSTIYNFPPYSQELKTFLATNNVWSNADYVEVEYDLHETQNILARKQFIIANQPHIESASGNFVTDMAALLKECKVGFEPIQEGSGDPSPENVRPISGWTGLSLYHSGENLYVPNPDNKGYINVRGEIKVDTTSTYTDLIPVTAGETYSFKCTTVSVPEGTTNRRLHGYDSNGNWVMQITNRTTAAATVEDVSIVVTIPSDVSYIRVSFRNRDTNVRIAKEDVIGVNWETEAGTVYEGYVDLVNGEIIQTYQVINLANVDPVTYGADTYDGVNGTNIMYYIPRTGTGSGSTNGAMPYSDKIKFAGKNISGYWIGTWSKPDLHIWEFCINASEQLHVVFDNATVGITQDMTFAQKRLAAKAWLQDNPITIIAPLETPVHYSLTPTQLKTLRGTNNIWSNANGPVEVQYWTH